MFATIDYGWILMEIIITILKIVKTVSVIFIHNPILVDVGVDVKQRRSKNGGSVICETCGRSDAQTHIWIIKRGKSFCGQCYARRWEKEG